MTDRNQEVDAPEKEQPPKKKTSGCVWAILIVVILIILIAAFGNSEDTNDAREAVSTPETDRQTERTIKAEEPKSTPRITAAELWTAYDSNELAADKKYKDKKLIVTGIVQDIGKDIVDTAYITLETENAFQSVQCMFGKNEEETLVILSKGQNVEIIGTCNGAMVIGGVLMIHCKLNL